MGDETPMRIILYTFLFSISINSGAAPFQGPFLIETADAKREAAKVFLPAKYEGQKWPVVLLLHGYGSSADMIGNYFALKNYVTSHGFILVVPNGKVGVFKLRYWNATDACCDFAHTQVDDVAYLRSLINEVKTKYAVDDRRIYLAGHSNGGFMSHRLACEIGEEIAGIASFAGVNFHDDSMCAGKAPVSVLQIHARDDSTIKYNGAMGFMVSSPYPGARITAERWAARNGCSTQPVRGSQYDLTAQIPGVDTDTEVWPCTDGVEVELSTIRPLSSSGRDAHTPRLTRGFAERILGFLLRQTK